MSLINLMIKRSVPIKGGVRVATSNEQRKIYLIIPGAIVPPDWVTFAFNLKGQRFDVGYGDDAKVVFGLPIEHVKVISQSLPILLHGSLPKAKIRGVSEQAHERSSLTPTSACLA